MMDDGPRQRLDAPGAAEALEITVSSLDTHLACGLERLREGVGVTCMYTQGQHVVGHGGSRSPPRSLLRERRGREDRSTRREPRPGWFTLVVDPFFEYVLENHRDDASLMWTLDPTGEQRTNPILDERSIELFEPHSQEFQEAMNAGS